MTDEQKLVNSMIVVDRYIKILHDAGIAAKQEHDTGSTSLEHLLWMLYILKTNVGISANYTLDKVSRWIGYIQYGLAINNLVTVEEERNFTRPLFTETK